MGVSIISDKDAREDFGLNRYLPIPANGRCCPISGLGHATLWRLLNGQARNSVRVASLRQPGQVRAKCLYHVGDLMAYLDGLASRRGKQNTGAEPAEACHAE